jgi:hypothetical protein
MAFLLWHIMKCNNNNALIAFVFIVPACLCYAISYCCVDVQPRLLQYICTTEQLQDRLKPKALSPPSLHAKVIRWCG